MITGDKTSQLVAVKTLNKGVDEGDKVKFLQEAAIMGQFKHPNVVKLYGVVTEEEPVSGAYMMAATVKPVHIGGLPTVVVIRGLAIYSY